MSSSFIISDCNNSFLLVQPVWIKYRTEKGTLLIKFNFIFLPPILRKIVPKIRFDFVILFSKSITINTTKQQQRRQLK